MRVVVAPFLASTRISAIIQMDSRLLLNKALGNLRWQRLAGISGYKMSVHAYS